MIPCTRENPAREGHASPSSRLWPFSLKWMKTPGWPRWHICNSFNRGTDNPQERSDMTQILLDAALASKLNDLKSPAELCDPSGRVVGRFVPAVDLSEWELPPDDISEEELDR